jgi:hypothetical protein
MTEGAEQIASSIETAAAQAAAKVRQLAIATDWVAAFEEQDVILSDKAGIIGNCSAATVRRRAVDARDAGKPIGRCVAGVWLISLRRWLADIERRDGKHAMLEARTRAEKLVLLSASLSEIGSGERLASG